MRLCPILLCSTALAAVEISDPAEFLVNAGVPAQVHLRAAAGATVAWSLEDWQGRSEVKGTVIAGSDGLATVALTPAAGWHELVLDGASRHGLLALDPTLDRSEPDPYFNIDSALSWLVKEDLRRNALAGQIRRLGFAWSRERLAWWSLQPTREGFNWDGRFRDDSLRQLYARNRVPVLECFHDAPLWLGQVGGNYPRDLVGAAESWSAIGARWTPPAVEVWNEPDAAEFSGDGTADQLAATTRAVAWGLRRSSPATLVAGGVFTYHVSAEYRRACYANGLLAASDVLTYHDYRDPDKLQPWLTALRAELAEAGDPAIPLWITEAGKAWPAGSNRPKAADDMRSGAYIAVRAAEARACGVQRYFAFVLPFYPEGRNNFSMTAPDGTPLRSLAAYSQVARRLAGLAYRGDLDLPGARSARVFADQTRAVAVVWLADAAKGRLAAGVPVRSAHGLDGRVLALADGGWSAPEGACLLELDPAALAQVRGDGPAMALWRAAQPPRPRPALSPVLLHLMTEAGVVSSCLDDYRLATVAGGTPVTVRVSNLGDSAATATVRLTPPGGPALEQQVSVPPRSHQEAVFRIAPASGTCRIEGRLADGAALAPVVVGVRGEVDGAAILAQVPAERRRRLAAAELAASDDNIGPGNTITRTVADDGTLRLRFQFKAADHWAFPRTTLPADARFDRYDAVLLRARSLKPAAVRLFLYESGGAKRNVGWYTPSPTIASDGAWHWALVRLSDLRHCPAAEPDPDGVLTPAEIDRISLGANTKGSDNTLEISHCELLRLDGLALAEVRP
jgi:hypothetical protein